MLSCLVRNVCPANVISHTGGFVNVYSSPIISTTIIIEEETFPWCQISGIHQWPVNSQHKRPVTRKMFRRHEVKIISHNHLIWMDSYSTKSTHKMEMYNSSQKFCFCPRIECDGIYSWWRHQMETFSALPALCAGNSPVTGEFPTQRPVLMFSLICA